MKTNYIYTPLAGSSKQIKRIIHNYIDYLDKLPEMALRDEIQKVWDETKGIRKIEVKEEWRTK